MAVDALEGDDDDNNGINDNEFASMAEHVYPSWQGKFDSEDEDGEENGYTVSSKDSQEAEPAVVVIDGSSGSDSEDAGGSGSALPLLAATGDCLFLWWLALLLLLLRCLVLMIGIRIAITWMYP